VFTTKKKDKLGPFPKAASDQERGKIDIAGADNSGPRTVDVDPGSFRDHWKFDATFDGKTIDPGVRVRNS